MPSRARGNPDCYAQAHCDCQGRVEREHYVSESILELVYGRAGEVSKLVLVRGLRFQEPGVVEPRGVGNLTAKILCRYHNGLLSHRIDPAGLAMFKAMDALNEAVGDPGGPEQVFQVDGDDLERWMLKTFIGGLFSGNFQVPQGTTKGDYPPSNWLDILFKGAEFADGIGLYWLAGKLGSAFTADAEVLQVEPITEQVTDIIYGLRVRFFGFNFALSMGRMLPGGGGPFENIAYRPAGIKIRGCGQIAFTWKAGAASDDIVVGKQP